MHEKQKKNRTKKMNERLQRPESKSGDLAEISVKCLINLLQAMQC